MAHETESWRMHVVEALANNGEAWADVIACTLPEARLNEVFPSGHRAWGHPIKEAAFTVWTAKRVYFPVCYDGMVWCGSAPRDPCTEATAQQGGG